MALSRPVIGSEWSRPADTPGGTPKGVLNHGGRRPICLQPTRRRETAGVERREILGLSERGGERMTELHSRAKAYLNGPRIISEPDATLARLIARYVAGERWEWLTCAAGKNVGESGGGRRS